MADVWKYGGRELAIDVYDADGVSRLGEAARALKDGIGRAGGEKGAVGALISRFFDEVFGDGAANLLFPGAEADGADDMMRACAAFAEFVTERCRAAGEEIGKWEKKYLPAPEETSGP